MTNLQQLSLIELERLENDIMKLMSQYSTEESEYKTLKKQLTEVEKEIAIIKSFMVLENDVEESKRNITSSIDMIINAGNFQKLNRGFIAQEGMNIYVQCPECGEMHKIVLGQCYILNKDKEYKDCCVDRMGDLYTADIFRATPTQYIYSDSRYCLHDNKNMDNNIELYKSLAKVMGECIIEHWNLYDETLLPLTEFMQFDYDYNYLVNKEDKLTLMHLAYYNIPLNRFYIIDNELNVEKLNSVKLDIKIDTK